MKLDDTAIAQIVKLIQMALLTGTDIVDHLRMMILDQGDNEKLVMNKEYQEVFDASIEKMLQNSNTQDEEGLEPSE
jgi:Asp-tRNA(Asn)/Glu-tRNA(Gln) amidotransferase B subunit